jgi:hypothetical protein
LQERRPLSIISLVIRATVGKSSNRSSRRAGEEAARQARDQMGDCAIDLALVFATTGYDQQALLDAIGSVIGSVPLAGCSAEGVITPEASDEGSHAVALMLISSDTMTFTTVSAAHLGIDSATCGRVLAQAIGHAVRQPRALLLFPDGLTSNCSPLLSALQQDLPELPIAGGTASDMMRFERTYQYHDREALTDAVSGVLLEGAVDVEIAVSHGCDAIGLERTITRAQGRVVEEIDGRPAWEVFREYLDGQPETLRGADDVSQLAIAERPADVGGYGEHYGEYVIRVPLGHDEASGALRFGAEMPAGARVSMTRRVPHRVMQAAVSSVERIRERHPDQQPALVLQFDCAGRGRMLFGERCTQMGLRPLQHVLGETTPWLGCYTFGEIAPPRTKTHFHNFTVVVIAVYERKA